MRGKERRRGGAVRAEEKEEGERNRGLKYHSLLNMLLSINAENQAKQVHTSDAASLISVFANPH